MRREARAVRMEGEVMAIERYTGQPLTGKIICRESHMTHGLCSMPVAVLKETKASLRIQDLRDGDERTVRKHTTVLVCDTQEEGWRAHAVAQKHLRAEFEINRQQATERGERKRAAIDGLVASGAGEPA